VEIFEKSRFKFSSESGKSQKMSQIGKLLIILTLFGLIMTLSALIPNISKSKVSIAIDESKSDTLRNPKPSSI
jgi:hypothetical protein